MCDWLLLSQACAKVLLTTEAVPYSERRLGEKLIELTCVFVRCVFQISESKMVKFANRKLQLCYNTRSLRSCVSLCGQYNNANEKVASSFCCNAKLC